MYVTLLVIERKKNGINYIFVHHINSIPGGGGCYCFQLCAPVSSPQLQLRKSECYVCSP